MNNRIELLAPGGDIDSIKAAIVAGADAVYCGLDKFNARNRATNISFDDLNGILRLAHKHNCQVFLTLNIIIVDSEIPAVISLLNKLVNTSIDGIILQDLGLFYLIANHFKSLKIHASTQLTTHNEGQVAFLSKINATRVNLSRELNNKEIKTLAEVAHSSNMLTEVFVHGSNCISFSGLCYMSSVLGGNSGNRGRCSQPCRDEYKTTLAGKNFPLNLKDNSAYSDLKELSEAGVDSIKIEGRIKKFHYVFTVVDAWRKQLQQFYDSGKVNIDKKPLHKVFNRGFSNAFLKGEISADMFIDNPRDNSAIHLAELDGGSTDEKIEKAKGDIYNDRTEIITSVENEISNLSISKAPLQLSISGEYGKPLKISVTTPESSFDVFSETNLANIGTEALQHAMLLKRLKAINETEYYIENLELKILQNDVYLPFKDLTTIKKKILFILNGSRKFIDPIEIPVVKNQNSGISKPALSVLISSAEQLQLINTTSASTFFQLPESLKLGFIALINVFRNNENLIPWFPPILIGDDYDVAVEFLAQLQPKKLVTDNSGIAFEAYKREIPWIAGPSLNIVNSFSLLNLKENFKCIGAFISNEISKLQIKGIKCPADFELYYSIYHPIVLMTSRQCLFHQVTGCDKLKIDETCIPFCKKSASITNLKNETFQIDKSKGNHHRIYNDINYLNTEVITDFPVLFTGFLIDLRDIKTKTTVDLNQTEVIRFFEDLLNGKPGSKEELNRVITPTTNEQYKKGI